MRIFKIKRIMNRLLLFIPLLFVIVTCGRLFILANNTIFVTEPEMAPRMVNGSARGNHLALDRLQVNVSSHGLYTESSEDVKLPPFVDSHDATGPGENGVAVNINRESLTSEEKVRFDQGMARHNFNQYVSDIISVHRRLPDCTPDHCRKLVENFQGTLPEISVIITFFNEAWSTLLRSVHSVINRTPAHILKQIILVDDNSTFDYLKAPLDKYFSSFPLVKIIHATGRIGLIQARLLGFDASVSPVVVFLDSHIECLPGWVEPLLVRISRNPRTVVFPLMPKIDSNTFGVSCYGRPYFYCGFNWKYLQLQWVVIPKRVWDMRQDEADSIKSPTMPGGLFAINREFFLNLGKYDPELAFWGGENLELSFKTWMCGGSLEMDTCSMVGHVFREPNPYQDEFPQESLLRNVMRVAEVWMDDYKNYRYERTGYKFVNVGDLTDRFKIRESLQCNSFEWYLKNIYPEQTFPHNMTYAGGIRSKTDLRCITNTFDSNTPLNKPTIEPCLKPEIHQVWYMDASSQINQDDIFLCEDNGNVVLHEMRCKDSRPQWEYKEGKWLYHLPTGMCLTIARDNYLSVTPCTNSGLQLWHFEKRRSDLTFPSYL